MASKQYTYKGMLQDISKSKHPNNFYFEANNIRIVSTDDNMSSSATNEKGNELLLTLPSISIVSEELISEELTLNIIEGSSVKLTWGSTYGSAATYYIYRSEDNLTYSEIKIIQDGDNEYIDYSTLDNTRYFYKIVTSIGNNFTNINETISYDITTSNSTLLDIYSTGINTTDLNLVKIYWNDDSINLKNTTVQYSLATGPEVWDDIENIDGSNIPTRDDNYFEIYNSNVLNNTEYKYRVVRYDINDVEYITDLINYTASFAVDIINDINIQIIDSSLSPYNTPNIRISFIDNVNDDNLVRDKLYYLIFRLQNDSGGSIIPDDFIDLKASNLDIHNQLFLEGSNTYNTLLSYYDNIELGYDTYYIIKGYSSPDYSDLVYESGPYNIKLPTLEEVLSVTAVTTSSSTIDINWNIIDYDAINTSPNFTGYNVIRSFDNVNELVYTTNDINDTSFVDLNSIDGVSYVYTVHTTTEYATSEGVKSDDIVSGSIEPVTNISVITNSTTSTTLNWEDSITEGSNYNIYRSIYPGGSYNIISQNQESLEFIDNNLNTSLDYIYDIRAVNNNIESESSLIVIDKFIDHISSLIITNTTVGSANLSWVKSPNNQDLYNITITRTLGSETIVLETNYVDVENYTDNTVMVGNEYTYNIYYKSSNLKSLSISNTITIIN